MKLILFGFVYIFCTTINPIECYYGAEDLITSFDQQQIFNCTDLNPQRSINIEQVRFHLQIEFVTKCFFNFNKPR